MTNPAFNDRVERKYQVGVSAGEVATLWRDLRSFLLPHGLAPVPEITSVGSVYFDNKDCDLLRYSLFGRLFLVRVRTYELYGHIPEPLKEYWVEVKTAQHERRKKKRFWLGRAPLAAFLDGKCASANVLAHKNGDATEDKLRTLYRETQETVLTMGLKPILLVLYKRIAFQGPTDRLSVDWDLQYYYVSRDVFEYDSWKYIVEKPTGTSDNVILETKFLGNDSPAWFPELQQRFPIRRREYLKPVEGMGLLFRGPLQYHHEANYFIPRIESYMIGSQLG